MKVIGITRVIEFGRRHPDAKSDIDSWVYEARAARWTSPMDLKHRYQQASILPGNRVVFNIRGNYYRLVTDIDYGSQIVLVKWIGTHTEYDRKVF